MVHSSVAFFSVVLLWLCVNQALYTWITDDKTPKTNNEETCPVNIDEFKGRDWLLEVNDEIYSSNDTLSLIAYLSFKYHFLIMARSDLPNNTFIVHFNRTALDKITGEPGETAFSVRCRKELFVREMERRFKLNRVIRRFGRNFNLYGYYKNKQGLFQGFNIKNTAKGAEVFLDTPTSSCEMALKRPEDLCN